MLADRFRRLRASASGALLPGALAALSFLSPLPASAQRLPFTVYSADEGLAASQVWHVMQDRRGYLWVSTTWGLCRYDGVSFLTLSVPDGLPSPNVRLTLEDANGTLWIGTNGGLASYDGRELRSYADRGGAFDGVVWAAASDRYGVLWFGTDRGLISYDGSEFRTYTRSNGLSNEYIYSLLPASDGSIWLGSRGSGVTRCTLERGGRLGSCRIFTTADGLGNDSVRAIAEDATGTLYFGTRGGGVTRFDGHAFSRLSVADGLPGNDIYALLPSRDGSDLLVGSSGGGVGICPLPAAHPCRLLREENGLADNGVHSLLEDREGSLWIGSEGGLTRLVRRDLWSYGEREGLPNRQVYALASDGGGGIWAGTYEGLAHLTLNADGAATSRVWHLADGLPSEWVWALARTRRGDLWVGTDNGLARLLPTGRFATLRVADGLAGNYVVALFEDHAGALWVGTIEGVSRLRLDAAGGLAEIRSFRTSDGLARERSYAIAEDAGGRLFVAHGEGLSYFDGVHFHAVGSDSGLDTRSVRSLGRTSDGTLWAGGYARLARLVSSPGTDAPRFVSFGAESGLSDHLVLTIADDIHGHLLLGTNRGVLLFDPAARNGGGAVIAHFDRASGAIATEVSHSSAFVRDERGRFWFGFKGGLTALPRDLDRPAQAEPPPVVFERLATRSGREIRAAFSGVSPAETARLGVGPVVLSPSESNLRIEVRALTFRGDSPASYQFQLVGFESSWSAPQLEAFRDYTNLDPGKYSLRVRASLASPVWSAPVELALEVRPAWFQRRIVPVAATGLLLAGLFAAAAYRTRAVRKRNRALEREVTERTDDLARYARALEEHAHALDRANERIRLADRHRGEFLAKMSHELRTPLTSVLGFAALLADGLGPALQARYARYLENIRESGNHLLRLINNLLDQAKIEAGRMDLQLEPANLESIVESALSMMEGYGATRGVELKARLDGDVPAIVVDVAKLRQAILNLLSNAIKFSGRASEVEVRTYFIAESSSPLGVDSYEIVVADQGPGIHPDDQERIFEPFRQLAPRGETSPGTGLGLPIARQFIALLGGVLEVDSGAGAGAAFRIRLPVDATTRSPGVLESAIPGDGSPGDRPRVVVLEPDRARFTTMAGDLERQGFLAVRAPDSEEGRRMLRELRPAVVAVNIQPARLDAWSTLLALERDLARWETPLVLFAFASGSERGVAASFESALQAPASATELLAALAFSGLPKPGLSTQPGSNPGIAPRGRRAIWLAAGSRNAPGGIDRDLAAAGFLPERVVAQSRALAAAAAGDFAAVVLDLADRDAGGFELAVEAQSGGAGALVWIALIPEVLTSSERKRLLEYVEGASGAAGAAIAAAAVRVTRSAAAKSRAKRELSRG